MLLGLAIAGGTLVLVTIILVTVFTLIARMQRAFIASLMHQLEGEGIVKDSGSVRGSARFRNYRAPGMYIGVGIRGMRSHLILTKQHLVVAGTRAPMIPVAELRRYKATNLDGVLSIASDEPYNASGHIELRLRVPDVDIWVRALRDAGAGS